MVIKRITPRIGWFPVWQAPHPPPLQGGAWEIAKKSQKGGPGIFWFDKGGAEEFFHVQLGGRGVWGTVLVEAVPPLPANHMVFLTGLWDLTLSGLQIIFQNLSNKCLEEIIFRWIFTKTCPT